MTSSISTLGIQLLTNSNLQTEQTNLSNLNEQLASGDLYDNLTDYTPADVTNILSFQNGIAQRQGYVSAMNTVSARLSVYNQTMGDMENVATQAQTLATANQSFDSNNLSQINAQVQAFLQSVQDDLNQQVDGRYIYAGTRYSTAPVGNLTQLAAPTLPFTALADTPPYTLPAYDSQAASQTVSQAAWTQDSVTVDDNYTLTYGVTSNAQGFQELISGLSLMNAATQSGASSSTYSSNMTQAATLLGQGLSDIQGLNAGVAGNTNTISQQTSTQNTDITNLQDQLSNIQQVNVTQVSVELNTLESQLQASYSATATLLQTNILKYL